MDNVDRSDHHAGLMWHSGIGDGRVRVFDTLQRTTDQTVARLDELRAEAQLLGSALIIENAKTEIKNRIDAWGTSGSSAGVMQRVKQELDPHGILSPGRFGLETQTAETR
jgi:glycolate oxidase FAD binding subunit